MYHSLWLGIHMLQLHYGLHASVIIVEIQRAHHLGALQISNAQHDLTDGVTAHQFDDLRRCGKCRVDFQRGQLHVLYNRGK